VHLLLVPGSQLPPGYNQQPMMSQVGPPGAPPSYPSPRPNMAQVYDECHGNGNPSPLPDNLMLMPRPHDNMNTTNTWIYQQPVQLQKQEYPYKEHCY